MQRFASLMLMFIAGAAHAQDDSCPQPATNADLASALSVLEQTITDSPSLSTNQEALATVAAKLPCLSEPITPELAARFHRDRGIIQEMGADSPPAQASFAACRAIDPGCQLLDAVNYAGENPFAKSFSALPLNVLATPLPAPLGQIRLDGRDTLDRVAIWPTIFQLLDEGDALQGTWLLDPATAPPPYPLAHDLAVVEPAPAETPPKKHPGKTMLIAGSVCALPALGAYGYARWQYVQSPDGEGMTDGEIALNHGLNIGATALGAAALGLGIGAAFAW